MSIDFGFGISRDADRPGLLNRFPPFVAGRIMRLETRSASTMGRRRYRPRSCPSGPGPRNRRCAIPESTVRSRRKPPAHRSAGPVRRAPLNVASSPSLSGVALPSRTIARLEDAFVNLRHVEFDRLQVAGGARRLQSRALKFAGDELRRALDDPRFRYCGPPCCRRPEPGCATTSGRLPWQDRWRKVSRARVSQATASIRSAGNRIAGTF